MNSSDFMLRLEAEAWDVDGEPDLNTAITEAGVVYARLAGNAHDSVDAIWRDAAAYGWLALTADPVTASEWACDVRRLAVISTMLDHHRARMDMMILGSTLLPDGMTLRQMRRTLSEGQVDSFDSLLGTTLDGPDVFDPHDRLLARNVATAMNVLHPIEWNAPTGIAFHIRAIEGAFRLAGGVSLWFCQSVWGCLLVAFSGAFRPVSGAVGVGPA